MKPRKVTEERKTGETDIKVAVNLDGTGKHNINTGIGFLDHMLIALAVHGILDLEIFAEGDIHIDVHHTVEDIGIVLGKALDKAVGDRNGIFRMAHAYVPMDEALGFVALDLSGRPYTVFSAQWNTPAIGKLPTDLVQHFFESVAVNARLTLHIKVDGRNDHHKAEAVFKAFGRALRTAVSSDPRREDIPSTKGTLT